MAAGVESPPPSGRVLALVEDNAPGFEPEDLAVARPGLAAVRERATLAGGRLDVDSAPDGGTTPRFEAASRDRP